MKIEGIYTASVTPFEASGKGIHEKNFRFLIERQVNAGISGLIISGSTGEGQTLDLPEWKKALDIAVSYKDKIQIFGACGSSGTEQTLERLKLIEEAGANGALVSTPAYNKPPQRGLIKHFEFLTKNSTLPMMVYNIPGRTSVNILPSTMQEIWKLPNIVALKESSGNWEQIQQMLRECPSGKVVLSGDDPFNLPFWVAGARGTVSVLSNVIPKGLVSQWKLWSDGNITEAQNLQNAWTTFLSLLFVESNPIPVKFCMSEILGQKLLPRLPLVELDSKHHSSLREGLSNLKKWL